MRMHLWAVAFACLLPSCILATCDTRSRRTDESSDEDDDERSDRAKKKRAPKEKPTTKTSASTLPRPTPPTPPKLPPSPEIPLPPVAPPPVAPSPVAPSPVAPPPEVPEDRAKERSWVHQVALGSEFAGMGKSRAGAVARWTMPIRLSVMRGDTSVRADLLSLVPTLNETLEPAGSGIRIVGDGDAAAELKVYFAPSSEFASISKAHGGWYIEGNDGYFFAFWNARFELERVFVLIATDKLSGKRLRHITFEEVTQAMGLANDSALFTDSIFYENAADKDGETNVQTELTARDRKLLSFFYNRVKPGDGTVQLGRAFEAHWR